MPEKEIFSFILTQPTALCRRKELQSVFERSQAGSRGRIAEVKNGSRECGEPCVPACFRATLSELHLELVEESGTLHTLFGLCKLGPPEIEGVLGFCTLIPESS